MKKIMRYGVTLSLLITFLALSAYAGELPQSAFSQAPLGAGNASGVDSSRPVRSSPSGELILADVLVLRPLGIVALGVGLVGSVVAFPFAAITGSQNRVGCELIVRPYEYTFKRPVGKIDY